jgi:type VI secretion system secreted protein Hcp
MTRRAESIFRGLKQAGVAGLVAGAPFSAAAAEPVYLFLNAGGVPIQGESSVSSLGRANAIECLAFYTSAQRAADGSLSGGRFTCRKRIDKSSPLILKALGEREQVAATFKFFRPNPSGDGTTEQYYTTAIKLGRVVSIEQVVPDTIDPATAGVPPLESVTIEAADEMVTYTTGGISQAVSFPWTP